MDSAETVNDLAIAALFEFCVPAVTGGRLQQNFPADLIVNLTASEMLDYENAIGELDEAWRILSDDGFILLTVGKTWCGVTTGAGDPEDALVKFRERLAAMGGKEKREERDDSGLERVTGSFAFDAEFSVVMLFTADLDNPNAGFYGSAAMIRRVAHG